MPIPAAIVRADPDSAPARKHDPDDKEQHEAYGEDVEPSEVVCDPTQQTARRTPEPDGKDNAEREQDYNHRTGDEKDRRVGMRPQIIS